MQALIKNEDTSNLSTIVEADHDQGEGDSPPPPKRTTNIRQELQQELEEGSYSSSEDERPPFDPQVKLDRLTSDQEKKVLEKGGYSSESGEDSKPSSQMYNIYGTSSHINEEHSKVLSKHEKRKRAAIQAKR